MKKFFCLLFCVIFILLSYGCKNDDDYVFKANIIYNLEQEPKSLDPQIATDYSSQIVIMSLFEGLVRIGENGTLIPGVAETWTCNDNFTSFTFNLRDDAKWADSKKTPVKAQDFEFALKRALDPQTGSMSCSSLYCIKNALDIKNGIMDLSSLGVKALNDKTLVIDLEYEYEDFPKVMAKTVTMPCNEEFFNNSKGQYGLECISVLGNGPYVFTNRYSWEHGKSMELSRSSSYKGNSYPVPAGISFSIDEQVSNNANAIKNSIIDAAPISGESLDLALKNNMNLTSFEDTTVGLCFNLNNDIFKNTNIRKGLVTSLDRDYILTKLPQNYLTANDIIPPYTTIADDLYRDVAENNLYLKESDDAVSVLNSGLNQIGESSLPNLTVTCLDNQETKAIVSNIMQVWNQKFGVYFNMNPLSQDDLDDAISSGDYQIALVGIRAQDDGPLNFLSIFKSDNPLNPVKLKDYDYDLLLSKISEKKGEKSIPYCIEAEKYLNDNAIFYPMCYENRYFASAANVTGVIFHPYNGGIDFIFTRKEEKK